MVTAMPQHVNTPLIGSCSPGVRDITAQVNRDDRQAVGNDRCRGWGVEGKGVECEAEDKPGNLSVLPLLTFCLGSLGHIPRSCNVFLSGWFIVVPLDAVRVPVGQVTDHSHCVVEREAPEIGLEWKTPPVAPTYILKDARSRVRDRKMMKGTEKTHSGHLRKLFQPLCNNHLMIVNVNATDEDIKTICDKGGIEVDLCCHHRKVFQGWQADGFIQGRLEHP